MKQIPKHLILILLCFIISINIYSQHERQELKFTSNGNLLNAELFIPTTDTIRPALVLMHGYPGAKGDPLDLAKNLSAKGVISFVFNYQGTWSSEGYFNFENSMIDARNAVNFLKQKDNVEKFKIDTTNVTVGGYSFGGAMALAAAIYYPEIQRVVAVGGPNEAVYARKMIANENIYNMFLQMFKSFEYPDGPIKVNSEVWINEFLNDYEKLDVLLHADSLKAKDILLIGGWDDQNVLLEEHQIPLYRKLKELKAKNIEILVFDTNHSFKEVRDELTKSIFKWIANKN